jgi:hypothetical protein
MLERHLKRTGRNILVVVVAVFVIVTAFHLTDAGSLTPSAPPSGTMHDLQEIYDELIGTFDSSGVTASKDGSAMAIAKCIIQKETGGSICP